MGLAERRAAKEFETAQFPELKKQIDAAASYDVPVEVMWEALAVDGYAHLYGSCWPKVYFEPLVTALTAITADDMGKEALKAKLTKITIKNTDSISNAARVASFEGGVLTLDHKPCTNVDDIKDRTKAIQKLLEDNL